MFYEDFLKRLYFANDNEIFELTGCLSNCYKNEYKSKEQSFEDRESKRNPKGSLRLVFYYPATEHEVRKPVNIKQINNNQPLPHLNRPFKYYVYDGESFIADVGGLLGLLIGQSIYGVYDSLTNWLKLRK